MRVEVMEHYGLTQSIEQAGYYGTAHHKLVIVPIFLRSMGSPAVSASTSSGC